MVSFNRIGGADSWLTFEKIAEQEYPKQSHKLRSDLTVGHIIIQILECEWFFPDFEGMAASFHCRLIGADQVYLQAGILLDEASRFFPADTIGKVIIEEKDVRNYFLKLAHPLFQGVGIINLIVPSVEVSFEEKAQVHFIINDQYLFFT